MINMNGLNWFVFGRHLAIEKLPNFSGREKNSGIKESLEGIMKNSTPGPLR